MLYDSRWSMPAFVDVFIDGTVDGSPGAIKRAAASVARLLAVPESRAMALLAGGRVKVRSNLAPELATDLVRLLDNAGIRTAVVPVRPTTLPSMPALKSPAPTERRPTAGAGSAPKPAPPPPPQDVDEGAITGVFDSVTDPPRIGTPMPPGYTPNPPGADDQTDPRAVRPRR